MEAGRVAASPCVEFGDPRSFAVYAGLPVPVPPVEVLCGSGARGAEAPLAPRPNISSTPMSIISNRMHVYSPTVRGAAVGALDVARRGKLQQQERAA